MNAKNKKTQMSLNNFPSEKVQVNSRFPRKRPTHYARNSMVQGCLRVMELVLDMVLAVGYGKLQWMAVERVQATSLVFSLVRRLRTVREHSCDGCLACSQPELAQKCVSHSPIPFKPRKVR